MRSRPRIVVGLLAGLGVLWLAPVADAAVKLPFNTFGAVVRDAGSSALSETFTFEPEAEGFTLQEGEGESGSVCTNGTGTQKAFSTTQSGWVRFEAAVSGKLTVTLTTNAYLGMVVLWGGQPQLGPETFAHLAVGRCAFDEEYAQNVASTAQQVLPNQPIDIETNRARCIEGFEVLEASEGCPSGLLRFPADETTLTVAFTPDDRDGDGVPDTIDACPSTPGSLPNGCPPPPPPPPTPPPPRDSDGDGTPDSQDKCPTEFASRSISLPGDGRAGCPEPLSASLPFEFGVATTRGAFLVSFNAEAPPGSQVTLSCHGHACPGSLPVTLTTTKTSTALLPLLHRGRLRRGRKVFVPVGTTITATVAHRGTLGRGRSLTPRRNGAPKHLDFCVSISGKALKCPS